MRPRTAVANGSQTRLAEALAEADRTTNASNIAYNAVPVTKPTRLRTSAAFGAITKGILPGAGTREPGTWQPLFPIPDPRSRIPAKSADYRVVVGAESFIETGG